MCDNRDSETIKIFFVLLRRLDIFVFHPSVRNAKYGNKKTPETDELRIFLASPRRITMLFQRQKKADYFILALREKKTTEKVHTSKKSPITQSGHRKRSRRPFQMTRVCKMFKIIQNFYFLEFHGKQTNRGQFLTILDKIVFFCLFLRFWVFFTICFSKCINNGDVETLGFTFICQRRL